MSQQKTYRIAVVVSILLHLLMLLLYRPLIGLSGLLAAAEQAPAEEPLTFEFEEPPKPQELVETPEEARVDQPENARFLSDKNARAQDQYTADHVPAGLPFSEGRSPYKTFEAATPSSPQSAQQPSEPQPDHSTSSDERSDDLEERAENNPQYAPGFAVLQGKKFSRALLQQQAPSQPNAFSDDQNWDNRSSSSETLGGVSLSTYDWDYAPYIFYMKKRIRDHLYPPQAFIQMGAISGQVMLRFTLRRDGTVRNLEFLKSEGHKSFIEPSLNAIRASDPFKPLPANFPEPELDLTWTFIFTVYQ